MACDSGVVGEARILRVIRAPTDKQSGALPAVRPGDLWAVASGHLSGASGARILTTLVHETKRREEARYGLATTRTGVS